MSERVSQGMVECVIMGQRGRWMADGYDVDQKECT